MAQLFDKFFQAVNSAGQPLSGAKLYFYQAGTTTDLTTYQTFDEATPHANPVVADATGMFPAIFVAAESYKFVLKTSADVTILTVDNIRPGSVAFLDGTAVAPSMGFAADTDTGIYRIGANQLGVAAGGTKILHVRTTGLSVTGDISTTGNFDLSLGNKIGASLGLPAEVSLTFHETDGITSGDGFLLGSATGGNKGGGTINAKAVYDDNVLLTDLVLDMAVTGAFDHESYEGHPIATELQPWWFDIDAYAAFWREHRYLPGMVSWTDEKARPSTGEQITRLTAVVETLAAHIATLNDRLKAAGL